MLAEGAKPMQTDLHPIRQGGGDLLASCRERELTLRDLLQMLRRRQRIVYGPRVWCSCWQSCFASSVRVVIRQREQSRCKGKVPMGWI